METLCTVSLVTVKTPGPDMTPMTYKWCPLMNPGQRKSTGQSVHHLLPGYVLTGAIYDVVR